MYKTAAIHRVIIAKASALIVALIAFGLPSPAQGQTYTLSPAAFLEIRNASGAIVSGGCIRTMLTGTNTDTATYQTSSGTLHANPIIASSAGTFTTFLVPGTVYRFRYEATPCSAATPGATIRTVDGIAAVPTSGQNIDLDDQTAGEALSLGDLVYLSDGSGGLTAGRWYQADADNTYSSSTAVLVGFAPAAITSGAEGTIRIAGRMTGLSLTAGETYYASATAAALTATPPTNARCIGKADSITTLILPCEVGDVRIPDSDGTHNYVTRTDANLTADRVVTMNFGDAVGVITHPLLSVMEGRCTLTTGVAVTTADVTAATTLYYTPYKGNRITLYDGSAQWNTRTFSELSIAVPATTSTMYDVFVDYTAGVPVLEAVAWTNDTTRATALATQNGVYVQTSDTDSRYVCSFRTTTVSGQTEDSVARRFVWNYYNRVPRALRVLASADTWTYTTATLRQANASTANQLDLVIGVAEVMVDVQVVAIASSDQATGAVNFQIGIGEDSTTAQATEVIGRFTNNLAANVLTQMWATLRKYPAVGRHFYAWLEYSTALGATTWYGDNGATLMQTGIHGFIEG